MISVEIITSLNRINMKSVFKDYSYEVQLTNYSKDGGIDILLHDTRDRVIGVQVKRHRRRIQVEQIRSFLGALLLGGHTKGAFVSMSDFQAGAKKIIPPCSKHVPIKLIDPHRFYDLLKVVQVRSRDPDDYGFEQMEKPKFSFVTGYYLNSL